MRVLCFILLAFALCSSARTIGYIGLFESSGCNADPVAVSPIFEGISTPCVAIASTCMESIRPTAQPERGVCVDINTELFDDGTGIHLTFSGVTQDIPFDQCVSSNEFNGCFAKYIPANDRFTIRGTGTPNASGFVAFLDYLDDNTCDVIDARIPIFEGQSTICSFDDEDNCSDQLRGQISSSPDRNCHTTTFTRSGCFVTGDESHRIGDCDRSDFHPRCDFQFSDGTERLDVPCGNSNSSSSNRSDDDDDSSTNDDGSNNNDDDDDSSSSASVVTASLIIIALTLI